MPPVICSGALHVPRHPVSTGDSSEYRQHYQALRQRRHLIEPLGFELDDKRLRRAGLDYHEYASVRRYPDLQSCLEALGQPRLFAFTTKGSRAFHEVAYQRGDAFLFGPESRGLPEDVRNALPTDRRLRLPMREGCRSLNLSNTVAVTVYEAWRQLGFAMD